MGFHFLAVLTTHENTGPNVCLENLPVLITMLSSCTLYLPSMSKPEIFFSMTHNLVILGAAFTATAKAPFWRIHSPPAKFEVSKACKHSNFSIKHLMTASLMGLCVCWGEEWRGEWSLVLGRDSWKISP